MFNNLALKPNPLHSVGALACKQMVPEFDPEKGLDDFDKIPSIDEMEACLKKDLEKVPRKVSKVSKVFAILVSVTPVAAFLYLASNTALD